LARLKKFLISGARENDILHLLIFTGLTYYYLEIKQRKVKLFKNKNVERKFIAIACYEIFEFAFKLFIFDKFQFFLNFQFFHEIHVLTIFKIVVFILQFYSRILQKEDSSEISEILSEILKKIK
jgi:hypothetical protein